MREPEELINRLQELMTQHMGENYMQAIGTAFWEEIMNKPVSAQEKEKIVAKHASDMVRMVQGFSDYRECFSSAGYFLQLAIENMSPLVMKKCVDACAIMYGTEDVSDWFEAGWANATIAKVANVLNSINDVNAASIETINTLCNCIEAVAKAGEEYEELIPQNADFAPAVTRVLDMLSAATLADKSTEKHRKNAVKNMTRLHSYSLSGPDKLASLEASIDVANINNKTLSKSLLDAYNLMCDEDDAALPLQQLALRGPLTTASIHILNTRNEGSSGSVFLESCMYLSLLLSTFAREDVNHMNTKRDMAATLQEMGVLDVLLKHMIFWAVDWNGAYGDCGRPIFLSIAEYLRHFPDAIKPLLQANPPVINMIRLRAAQKREELSSAFRSDYQYEDDGTAAIYMEEVMFGPVSADDTGVPTGQESVFTF